MLQRRRRCPSVSFTPIKQQDAGVKTAEGVVNSISQATFYRWRSKYGGMDASMIKRVKALEQENARLKKMYADAQLEAHAMKEALTKKW